MHVARNIETERLTMIKTYKFIDREKERKEIKNKLVSGRLISAAV